MKRHVSLQPLSREHHQALLRWRDLDKALETGDNAALQSASCELISYWDNRFLQHLSAEETVLLDLLTDELRQRLLAEHRSLRSLRSEMAASGRAEKALPIDRFASFAQLLRNHIRWEERVVFPFLQDNFAEDRLQQIHRRLIEAHSVP